MDFKDMTPEGQVRTARRDLDEALHPRCDCCGAAEDVDPLEVDLARAELRRAQERLVPTDDFVRPMGVDPKPVTCLGRLLALVLRRRDRGEG